jgi:hypothetical protein
MVDIRGRTVAPGHPDLLSARALGLRLDSGTNVVHWRSISSGTYLVPVASCTMKRLA